MHLVVTRPQPDGERTAAALRARGHDVLVAPLLRVEPVEADLAGKWSGVIVTSANALRAGLAQIVKLKALPVYVVGRHTADAARIAGFVNVMSADGDARDLVQLITRDAPKPSAPLLYLAADQRAADLESALAGRGIAVTIKVVYRTIANSFPPALAAALKAGTVDAVLHFSRRSAEAFVAGAGSSGVTQQALAVRHLCLSEQVAAPLRSAGATKVEIASQPDEAALISLAKPS